MPISNYPNGFRHGVNIRGLPVLNTHSGNVFWVDSGAGSNNNRGTFDRPLAGLDNAVGKCSANNGDVIFCKAGHSETISSDAGIALDVAGVTVIGLGTGSDRPTFTVATAAAANMSVTAANVSLNNLVFLGNKNDLVNCLEIAGDSCEVANCEFRESTNGMLAAISVGLADGDSDYVWIHDNKFYMDEPGVTNVGDAAIEILKDSDHITIERNHIYGDFDDAGIHVPAAGNACDFLVIQDNYVENTASGAHAIEITTGGTMNGGAVTGNILVSDAEDTLLESHTLMTANNYGRINNTSASDGWFPVGGDLGSRARRITQMTSSAMTTGNNYGTGDAVIFSVTGDVAARVWGTVDTAVTSTMGNGTVEVGTADNTAILVPQIAADGTNLAQHDVVATNTTTANADAMFDDGNYVVISNSNDIVVTVGTADLTGGVITWYCEWFPLTAGAKVLQGDES